MTGLTVSQTCSYPYGNIVKIAKQSALKLLLLLVQTRPKILCILFAKINANTSMIVLADLFTTTQLAYELPNSF